MHAARLPRNRAFVWALMGLRALLAAGAAALLVACATRQPATPGQPPVDSTTATPGAPVLTPGVARAWPEAGGKVLGQHERSLVYEPVALDSLAGIAARFLSQASRAWEIAQANGDRWQVQAGVPLVVPLRVRNPGGVTFDGAQTVPVLCYHRFGSGSSKMIVSPAQFDAQLEWLAKNRYRVLSLDELAAFLAGRQAVPQRSVVITIDDGYESVYRYAYPALKKYGFTATLFVYSDFVGARDGLSWAQLQDMAQSRVIDIQAHSKTHRNLIERLAGESDLVYRQNIDTEVKQPRWALERQLAANGVRVRHFAFPFGDANEAVLLALQQNEYALGLTVNAGGNAHFADPLLLRRTMIYGDHSLEDFKSKLQLRRPASPRP